MDALSTSDAVRRLANELELTLHLAPTEARDPWIAIQRRLAKLERWFERSRTAAVEDELAVLAAVVRKLRPSGDSLDLQHVSFGSARMD